MEGGRCCSELTDVSGWDSGRSAGSSPSRWKHEKASSFHQVAPVVFTVYGLSFSACLIPLVSINTCFKLLVNKTEHRYECVIKRWENGLLAPGGLCFLVTFAYFVTLRATRKYLLTLKTVKLKKYCLYNTFKAFYFQTFSLHNFTIYATWETAMNFQNKSNYFEEDHGQKHHLWIVFH